MLCNRFSHLIQSLTIIAFASVLFGCGDGDGPTPVADPTPPEQERYTLVWSDDFDVDGPPNVANWRIETGYGPNNAGWGNDEWQEYTDNTDPDPDTGGNVHVENGNLVITARCDGTPTQCSDDSAAKRTGKITSARINSKDKFEIKYGKIEARIKTPPGKGMWPAFWMLGAVFPDTPWPRAGEIDIMEMHQFFSNDRTTHFTVHWCDDSIQDQVLPEVFPPDQFPPELCEFGRTFDSRFRTFDDIVLTDDYHEFETLWDENRIIGKIDDITYYSKPIDPENQEEFLKRFFLILNVAVGGTLGGPPSASITWPQRMLVDWVKVYERNKPDVLEVVPQDPTVPLPFTRTVNSVEFGGDSVIADIRSTAVSPLVGDTVVELDYQSGNTFFSGSAFLFRLKDLTHYEKLVFSLYFDDSTFPDFADISIEMQDDRFNGEGDPGKTSLQLSDYGPPPVPGNWQTYEIPLTAFNLTNLDNVELFGFWNPKDSTDPDTARLIAGKLYLDDIKFVNEPCTANRAVSFNAPSYPPTATIAQVTVTDPCLANKNRPVVALVRNGPDTIGVPLTIDADGQGVARFNFGPTSDATSTIAINDGDELTVTYTYTDDNGGEQSVSGTAPVGVFPLAVYSETRTFPIIRYSGILNQGAVTSEVSTPAPLEGNVSLEADFSVPSGGSDNGFAFNFEGLVNTTFETDDASGGDVAGATGWTSFEFVFTNSTLGPSSGPVSHDAGGTQSLTMFGPFFFDGASGAYQADNTVQPGQPYTATAHAMNWAGDPLAPGNLGIFQLSFWDAPGGQDGGGNNLGVTEIFVDSTDDGVNVYLPPQDGGDTSDWTELSITEFAPAGAASAELFMLHIQLNDPPAGGRVFWDDVSVASTPKHNNISLYRTLKFGLNTVAAGNLTDFEVRMVDAADATGSVFLSNYVPISSTGDWDMYEIPLGDFAGLDLTQISLLGFFNPATTTGPFNDVLYFDDIHFVEEEAGSSVLTGILVNAPVEGVTFETATQSGITNALGEFQYLAGEIVTFSVGDIVLGSLPGAPIITPVELTGSVDPTVQEATNMLVFLQSIDADSVYSNGITVSAATRAAAVGQALVFTEPEFSAQIAGVVAAIADPNDPDKSVVDETTALDNFYLTYVEFGGTNTFPWLFPGYPPVPNTLGVYSETNIDPVLTYSEIIDTDTVTDETSTVVVALEGLFSLQAEYLLPASGNESGFSFNFGPATGSGANLLVNGTFEANDAFPGAVSCPPTNCDGWTAFESVFTKANVDQFNNFGPVSHDAGGTQSLQMFGPFTLNPNASGAYQAVDSVAAGTPYNATAYAMNWAPDTLTNIGIFQLSFWDAPGGQDGGGNNLGTFEVTVDSTTNPLAQDISLAPQDGADISDWTQLSISQTAPAGTASAQVFLLHIQTDPVSGGSLFWDDVSLSEAAPPVAGADISEYTTLNFGIDTSAVSGLLDLQVKMATTTGAESSVFLSNYSPVSSVGSWDLYEIPLADFNDPVQLDLTDVLSLGFWNPSSTVTGSTTVPPTLLPGTLFFDDIHFEK